MKFLFSLVFQFLQAFKKIDFHMQVSIWCRGKVHVRWNTYSVWLLVEEKFRRCSGPMKHLINFPPSHPSNSNILKWSWTRFKCWCDFTILVTTVDHVCIRDWIFYLFDYFKKDLPMKLQLYITRSGSQSHNHWLLLYEMTS